MAADVFCINLLRRPDRRARFSALLSANAPRTLDRLRFAPGVDGSALTVAQLEAATQLRRDTPPCFDQPALRKLLRLEGQATLHSHPHGTWSYAPRLLTRGAVGCAMAHIGIWERLAACSDPAQVAIVFEDDIASLAPHFDDKLDSIAGSLQTLSHSSPRPWDLCYLGHYPRPPGAGPVHGAAAATGLREVVSGVYGLFGYIISRSGARNLLKWRQRGRSSVALLPLSTQIDVALASRHGAASLLAVEPPLVHCSLHQAIADTDVQVVAHSERPRSGSG